VLEFKKNGFQFVNSSNDATFYHSMPNADTTKGSLQEFIGQYFSEETESKMNLIERNGKLVLVVRPSVEETLAPTYKDGFNSPAGTVYFERNKQNKIITMRISVGRARNVLFKKLS